MKCPHCMVTFHDRERVIPIVQDLEGSWGVTYQMCPACERAVISLIDSEGYTQRQDRSWSDDGRNSETLIRPKAAQRPAPSANVPDDVKKDFLEACLVFPDSAKSSAALSRRCLQHLLRKYAKVKPSNLNGEIDEILAQKILPSQLADSVDAIRTLGNFAAHPIKYQSTGEIVEVEPGEAEWNLDVLEALFDFYFDQPAQLQAKRDALDKKLKAAGKPPLKKGS